jgi:hypothetical protein
MKGEQMMLYKTVAASSTGVAEWISWGSKQVSGLMDSLSALMVMPASTYSNSSKYLESSVDVPEKTSSRSGKAAPSSPSGFAGSSFMRTLVLALMATSGMARQIDTCSSSINRGMFPAGNNQGVSDKLELLTELNDILWERVSNGLNVSSVALQVGDNHLGSVPEAYAASLAICTAGSTIPERNLLIANTMYQIYAEASGPYIPDFDSALTSLNLAGMEEALGRGLGITINIVPTSSPSAVPSAVPSASPSGSQSPSPTLSPTVAVTVHPSPTPTVSPTIEITISPSAAPTPGGTAANAGKLTCLLTAKQLQQIGCSNNPNFFADLLSEYDQAGCVAILGPMTNECGIEAAPSPAARLMGGGTRVLDLTSVDLTSLLHVRASGEIKEAVVAVTDPIEKDVQTNTSRLDWTGSGVLLATLLGTIAAAVGGAMVNDNRGNIAMAKRALSYVPAKDQSSIKFYAGNPVRSESSWNPLKWDINPDFKRETNISAREVIESFVPPGTSDTDRRTVHILVEEHASELEKRLSGVFTSGDRAQNAARTVVLSLFAKINELKGNKNISDPVPIPDGTDTEQTTTLDILDQAVDLVVGTDLEPAFRYLQTLLTRGGHVPVASSDSGSDHSDLDIENGVLATHDVDMDLSVTV